MSAIETDLRTYLIAQSPISSVVGTRIYPMKLPQGATLPAVTYQVIAGRSEFTHEGDAGLGRRRIQLDVWAETYAAVAGLAEVIREAVSGYLGVMGTNTSVAGRVVNQLDLSEPETPLWRRMVEIALWHQE